MTEFFNKKVTIYNDVPKKVGEPRSIERHVINHCNIQGGIVEGADGTVANIDKSKTITTKDVSHYLPPLEYYSLPADQRDGLFTADIDDFIVFAEVDDVVESSSDFMDLKKKYKNNGVSITAVNANLYGTALDNIQLIGG